MDSDFFNFEKTLGFNDIFGLNPFPVNKEQLKKDYIQMYIKGQITKKQLDEKMRGLENG